MTKQDAALARNAKQIADILEKDGSRRVRSMTLHPDGRVDFEFHVPEEADDPLAGIDLKA
ncbi:MAG: hypothetical protein AAGE80_05655 [Pseudomonadota bacterium]